MDVERRDSDQTLGRNQSHSQHSLLSDCSDESLLLEAPLARQPRCSIDIETTEPETRPIRNINERENAYLDISQLSDSVQEMSYVVLYTLSWIKLYY